MSKNVIETQRLILRDWKLSDLNDFSEMWTNPNVTVPQGDLPKQSTVECMPLLEHLISAKNNYAVVLKNTGKVIGSVGLNEDAGNNSDVRNLGYILNEDYWNNGYMIEALKGIVANGCNTLSAVFSKEIDNKKSLHIIEKLGFKFVKTIDGINKINGRQTFYDYYICD